MPPERGERREARKEEVRRAGAKQEERAARRKEDEIGRGPQKPHGRELPPDKSTGG